MDNLVFLLAHILDLSVPALLKKKIRVLNILDSFYKAETWFYSFNGLCVSVNIFMCVSVRLFPPVLQSKLPPLFFIFQ